MKKIILVDGNNLLFRSYYATAYNGNFMNNSKGFPTNALFGFTNMMNKILKEERPEYIMVAFDKGKTFRHAEYEDYKGGRSETPEELKKQFPIAKQLLEAMGIMHYEIDNYEADDIIGTLSEFCLKEDDFIGTIISSDKDLLQLINRDTDIKLLKQKDFVRYNEKTFKEAYGIEPINIIDLKALMGDPSDNIPGVKGIGEKTALKLLTEYKTLDNLYANINNIKGKLKEKLETDKENAYKSYYLATIIKDVKLDFTIEDTKYLGNTPKLIEIYKELEFHSLIKKTEIKTKEIEIKIIKDLNEVKTNKPLAIYLEILGNNYHTAEILGLGIYNDEINGYIPLEILKENPEFLIKNEKYVYDYKKILVSFQKNNIKIKNVIFDNLTATHLLNYNVKDDIAYIAENFGYNINLYENVYGKSKKIKPEENIVASNAILKAQFIYENTLKFKEEIEKNDLSNLYYNIEFPLIEVLADMEMTGVKIDIDVLNKMGKEIKNQIEILTKKIYELSGEEFNVASPSQLANILFIKMQLPYPKKNPKTYSTAIEILNKIKNKHEIIPIIIEYRKINKLYTTYIEGMKSYIINGKVHTIYTQNLTRTGRLSSIEPNLQNIPVRDNIGKLIRKFFVPSNDLIISADYSQIELRILSHIANIESLKEAFQNNIDIHTKTASDILKINIEDVTDEQRRIAKAVNFGIIYGISSFGLAENVHIDIKEAKKFIDAYFETYPGIREYMDNIIKFAKENGYVETLFKRKRIIEEINNKNYMIKQMGERIALNTPIQGTSADIIKLAMVKFNEKLKENNLKSKLIIQVHDELIVDAKIEEKEEIICLLKETMENIYKLSIPLKVDVNFGKNWYDAK